MKSTEKTFTVRKNHPFKWGCPSNYMEMTKFPKTESEARHHHWYQHHFIYNEIGLWFPTCSPRNKGLSGGCTLGGDRLTSHHWWVRRPKHRVACHWQAPLRRTSWDLTTISAKCTNSTKYLKNQRRCRVGEWVSKTTTRKKLKQLAGIVKTLPVDESMHLTLSSFQETFTCLRSMSCLLSKVQYVEQRSLCNIQCLLLGYREFRIHQ